MTFSSLPIAHTCASAFLFPSFFHILEVSAPIKTPITPATQVIKPKMYDMLKRNLKASQRCNKLKSNVQVMQNICTIQASES